MLEKSIILLPIDKHYSIDNNRPHLHPADRLFNKQKSMNTAPCPITRHAIAQQPVTHRG
jgi:hypothetical protein